MKPELLAPAGDLDKAKMAFLYGADAVYIGGKNGSLRARASLFDLESIDKATRFAHARQKKLYVTVNMVPHDEDITGLDDYLHQLGTIGVDALICSDPYVIDQALTLTTLPIHLSTQASTTNSLLINYWASRGVKRVVLARELTLNETREIRKHTDSELEVFIHGGMCVSYSGRCTLSNWMTGRDANRGGCAHSCRWKYQLRNTDLSINADFWMASKDLATIRLIPELASLGIDALKIEGRMKSHLYIASVVKAYRMLLDDVDSQNLRPFSTYKAIIEKSENRPEFTGFYEGLPDETGQIFEEQKQPPTQNFVGIVREQGPNAFQAWVETRNAFSIADHYEAFHPLADDEPLRLRAIEARDGSALTKANRPLEWVLITSNAMLSPYDIIRKVRE